MKQTKMPLFTITKATKLVDFPSKAVQPYLPLFVLYIYFCAFVLYGTSVRA